MGAQVAYRASCSLGLASNVGYQRWKEVIRYACQEGTAPAHQKCPWTRFNLQN